MIARRSPKDSYRVRIFLLAIVSLALIGLVGIRLFVLQVFSHDYYVALADSQHNLRQELLPVRGQIFIRDKYSPDPYPVVTNVNRPLVYVVPQQVKDPPAVATTLASVLEMDRKAVLSKISDQSKKYVPLAKEVPEDKAEKLKQLDLPGVFFEDETYQNYPEGQLASQVLGFVAYDQDTRVGRYGLENYFEEALAGKAGEISGTRDPSGVWVTSGDRNFVPAEDGSDLVLTIDRAIQFKVEEVLDRAVQQHGAKGGSVIVMNPKTGAILAMANYPTFDPNKFSEVGDSSYFNNAAIQGTYEPGSVMKAVTMAGGLQEGVVGPDTTFTDPGSMTIDKFTIRNAENKTYGEVNMTSVLDNSINMGAIFVEQKVGRDKFIKYMENFGFGKKTEIALPFEAKGNIDNLYRGGELYPATASFGQGITVTPLQMLVAYSAIANGGTLYKPYVVAEKIHADKSVDTTQPQAVRQVISQGTSSVLSAMLVSVVENGHGKKAAVPGYYIAGKTGTAQVPYADRPGYDPNRNIGSFAGFGPVDNPVFAMIVKIDEPQDVKFAESTAAPAFGEIAQFILNYYQVPKSR
ncbi:MAG: penicillin-binding protein 2 [Patescibacteria group bacterium]|nr:penicillin-binding protein 2 [Patescibacteria group bacterium]